MADVIDGYDAVLCDGDEITRKVIEKATNPKVVSHLEVGYGNIDIDAATERGIGVTHSPEASSQTVADFAFGLLLSCVRKIP